MQSKRERNKDPFIGYKLDLASSFIKGMYPKFFKTYTDKSDSFISRVLSKTDGKDNYIRKEEIEIVISAVSRDIPSIMGYVAKTNLSLKRVIKKSGKYDSAICISCGKMYIKSTDSKVLVCRNCLRKAVVQNGLRNYGFKPDKKERHSIINVEDSIKHLLRVTNAIQSYYKAREISISAVKPANRLFESVLWLLGETVVNETFEQSYMACSESLGMSPVSFKRKTFARILMAEQELAYEKTKGIRMPISNNILDFLYFLYTYTSGFDISAEKQTAEKGSAGSLQSAREKRKPLSLSLPNCPTIQP